LNGATCKQGICACPLGYTGDDCSEKITPSSMTIKTVEVLEYADSNAYFATTSLPLVPWDTASAPDVVVHLDVYDNISAEPVYQSPIKNDANLPISYTINQTLFLLQSSWRFYLFDDDSDAPNNSQYTELMGSFEFTPMDYAADRPEFITLVHQAYSAKIRLQVKWNYN
jgi:hypothetical protein